MEEWIVLDEARPGSRVSVLSGGSRPASRASELTDLAELYSAEMHPVRRTPDGLTASLALGMETQDSIAQAERSLGLAVKLDGIDSDFLRRSTEAIEALRKNYCSPFSSSDEEEEHDEAEAEVRSAAQKAANARDLRYGGRAPPFLGSLAPPAVRLERLERFEGAERESDKQDEGPDEKQVQDDEEDDDEEEPKLKFGTDAPLLRRWDRNDQAERRRHRREQRARKQIACSSPLSVHSQLSHFCEEVAAGAKPTVTLGGILRASMPLVLSHVCALLFGFCLGRLESLPLPSLLQGVASPPRGVGRVSAT